MAKIKNSFHESNTLEFSDAFILVLISREKSRKIDATRDQVFPPPPRAGRLFEFDARWNTKEKEKKETRREKNRVKSGSLHAHPP